ncbi:MAG: hypothetical protein ACLT63_12840 [Bacteroides xylanisolvens]
MIQSMGCQWMTAGSGILHRRCRSHQKGCSDVNYGSISRSKKWFHRHTGTLLRMTSGGDVRQGNRPDLIRQSPGGYGGLWTIRMFR